MNIYRNFSLTGAVFLWRRGRRGASSSEVCVLLLLAGWALLFFELQY